MAPNIRMFSNQPANGFIDHLIQAVVPNAAQKASIGGAVTKTNKGYVATKKEVDARLERELADLKADKTFVGRPKEQQRLAEGYRAKASQEIEAAGPATLSEDPSMLRRAGRYLAGKEGDEYVASHAATRIGGAAMLGYGVYDAGYRVVGNGNLTHDGRGRKDIAGIPFV